jgi:dTDP-4-dehydrorhamnose 3,5-epimerase
MPFTFTPLKIPEVILVEPEGFRDDRGLFAEIYKKSAFTAAGITESFVQDNYSCSRQGVLRGLHYQKHPKAQGKLVGVLRGRIFDVAVDLRPDAPTYGKWVGEELSSDNLKRLYIPPGFAHGFCVLSDEADVMYKVTAEYGPEVDRGVIWNDPAIGIAWPVPDPVVSEKDAQLPVLAEADHNFSR